MSSQMKRFYAVCVAVLCFLCLPVAVWVDTNAVGIFSVSTERIQTIGR